MNSTRPVVDIFYDMQDLRENGPVWKSGDIIVIEHLTMEDMQRLGEVPESDGVVRMSLGKDGGNATATHCRKLIDVPLKDENPEFISAALFELSRIGDGFKLATALKGEEIAMLIRPPKIPIS